MNSPVDYLDGKALQTAVSATKLRWLNAKKPVTNETFAETKEQCVGRNYRARSPDLHRAMSCVDIVQQHSL